MRTTKRNHKFTTLILVLVVLLSASLGASAPDEAMWAARIQAADLATLKELALQRSLDPEQSGEELRTLLLADLPDSALTKATQHVLLTVSHADEIIQLSEHLFLLRGAVSLTLGEQVLQAESITVDRLHELLVAEGGVYFIDGEEELSGDHLLLYYEEGTFQITDSIGETPNPTDPTISLVLISQLGQSNASGSYQHYRAGMLATEVDDPLSSIRAKEVLVRKGGDLFFKGATLYIGRVPMLYLPFVPLLRNQIVGNPTMGFSSDRGMFATTTWEIFGQKPALRAEQHPLFGEEGTGPQVTDGVLYRPGEPAGRIGTWASETDSYLALFADVSEKIGISMGVDTTMHFFSGRLQTEIVGAIGHTGKSDGLGYLLEPKIHYRDSALRLTLELPLYSDPEVKRSYLNRITAFSMLEALGKEVTFPTDFSSRITATELSLRGSFTAPTKVTAPYLSSFTISSFRATMPYRYQTNEEAYVLSDPTIAAFTARARGTLFSFTRTLTVKEKPTPPSTEKTVTPLSVAPDPLLPAYSLSEQSTPAKRSSSRAPRQSISLSYSLEERFNERRKAEAFNERAYHLSYTKGTLLLNATPHDRLFTISEELVAQLNTVEDPSKARFYTQEWQLSSHTRAQIPLLGFEYTLKQRIYHQRTAIDKNLGTEKIESRFAFDREQVQEHALSVKYPISLFAGTLNLGLKSTLYPLAVLITPSVEYSIKAISLSSSATIAESDAGYWLQKIDATARYKTDRLTLSVAPSYTFKQDGLERFSFKQEARYRFERPNLTLSELFHFYRSNVADSRITVEELRFSAETTFLQVIYRASGQVPEVTSESVQAKIRIADGLWRFYKNRMQLSLAIDSSLFFHFTNPYASHLEAKLTLGFWIAEFLDCSLSIASQNTGFFRYYQGDSFSFPLMMEDLARSFDFFGTGRRSTQFTLSSVSFALAHDLGDWSLNCKYSANIVLSKNKYEWVPTFSVYLSWKVLDELKHDEAWTVRDDAWVRTQ